MTCLYIKTFGGLKQDPGLTLPLSSSTAKTVHEDKMFGQQDILQFLSGGFKDYKYVKSPNSSYMGTLRCA